MPVLADYRSDVHNHLAGAVDASKWTPTMLDAALRLALGELNSQLVYEDDFEVQTTGYEQDLSGITAINMVVGAAYPWVAGSVFGECSVGFRRVGHNVLYFANVQPADGEIIRVRFTKLHAIDDLDSAAATTVPDAYRLMVGLWAAAYACEMRFRQVGEAQLALAAQTFRERAAEALSHKPVAGGVQWPSLGL